MMIRKSILCVVRCSVFCPRRMPYSFALQKKEEKKERLGLKRLLQLLELPRTRKEDPIIVKLEFVVYSRQISLTPSSLGFTM
jgi:hypothetical protein